MLFRLVDIGAPLEIHNATKEVLNIGAPLLLPQLKERVDFLQTHLTIDHRLSQGQQMLLEIILDSLQDPLHIAELLDCSGLTDKCVSTNYALSLMHTLVDSFSKKTVSKSILY